jgi:hypothetical protein
VQGYADQVLGWVKWSVVSILGISFFASVGMLVWGRVTHHPKGARLGFDGLLICLVGAIIYVAGYAIIASIIGGGCGGATPAPSPTARGAWTTSVTTSGAGLVGVPGAAA